MKYCAKCGSHKDLADFSANKRRKDGLSFYCKSCKNKESANWYAANKEYALSSNKSRASKIPGSGALRSKLWRLKNPEYERQARAANPEKSKEKNRKWRGENPHKVRFYASQRRSALRNRTPAWLTADDFAAMEFLYALARMLELETGMPHHVDHVIPLNGALVSGLHVPSNLQILTAEENLRKSNKLVSL